MADIWMDVDTALSEVPVNIFPLIDDGDFKTRETSVAYDAAGMDLVWNFVTTAGAMTQTAVTPTTSGNYDWASQGDGMYSIAIPASGGASINNDTEGFGWFTGIASGVLPWRGPVIGFRAAAVNNAMIDGGAVLDTNVTQISGDTTAADNAEDYFDGLTLTALQTHGDSNWAGQAALHSGTAQAGTSTTITLATSASSVNDFYNKTGITLTGGTGVGQDRVIEDYVGSTRVATLDEAWVTTPSSDTTYDIEPARVPTTASSADVNVVSVAAGAITAAAIATDAIDADALAADALTEIFTKVWTTALTEAYAADGAAPTGAQAVFLIQQMLTEMSISTVTMTVKKLDGSTTAATFTLNDADEPTSITRSG